MSKKSDELKGKIKGKAKVKKLLLRVMTKTVAFFLTKLLPIFIATLLIYEAFHWVTDLFDSKNNAKEAYKTLDVEEEGLSGLIEIAGNENDGYYLAYKEGFDEKLDELVKKYDKAGYQYMTKEIIKGAIESELYTQYPNLGGKVGHEGGEGSEEGNGNNGVTGNFNGVLCWPTIPSAKTISSYFGYRDIPIAGATADHGAIDIPVNTGTEVYTCQAGTVEVSAPCGTAGNMVQINHGNGYITKYMHNSELKVSVGQQVKQGELIALAGSTGASTGAHVHFQIEKNGVKIDPLTYKYNNGMGDGTAAKDGFYGTEDEETGGTGNNETTGDEETGGDSNQSKEDEESSSRTKLTVGEDTGEGQKGFQGAIRIRRVRPDKAIGSSAGAISGDVTTVTDDTANTSKEVKDFVENNLTDGKWSIYAKKISSNEDVLKKSANQKMQSASLIKLFIMATAYQDMQDNGTNIDKTLIQKMITVSDNNSTNQLIDQLGKEKINNYIKDNGYNQTELNRKMLEPSTNGDNYTSTKDVEKILEKIHKGECVSKQASEEMLGYLKGQNATSSYQKIRKDLPQGAYIGGKTGELSDVENDAAIITKNDITYILVMMSSNLTSTSTARSNIAEFSKLLYDKIDVKAKKKSENKKEEDKESENKKEEEKNSDNKKSDNKESNNKKSDNKEHIIAIDAGHGDPAKSNTGGYGSIAMNDEQVNQGYAWYTEGTNGKTPSGEYWSEWQTNQKIVDYIKEMMKPYSNIKIIQTGQDKPNCQRIRLAKALGAEAYIGIHLNSNDDEAHGTSVLIRPTKGQDATGNTVDLGNNSESEKFGKIFLNSVSKSLGLGKESDKILSPEENTRTGLQTYAQCNIPNIYIEGAHMNTKDMEVIGAKNDEGLKKYAQGVVNGILEYCGVEKKEEDDDDNKKDDKEDEEIVEETTTTSDSTIDSKVYDLKYTRREHFKELVEGNEESALEYYTLDENWNLIIATWTVDAGTLTINEKEAIDYKTIVEKYTTPFEYLLDYAIDIKDKNFMQDFFDLISETKIILAVEDNVTTVKIETPNSVSVSETVKTELEVTYVDTWFAKFEKETNLVDGLSTANAGTGNAGDIVNIGGTQGKYIGDYVISAYCSCSICCGPWAAIGLTASGVPPQAGRTVASNTLPMGSYIMFNNHVYHVEDTGSASGLGGRIDLYMNSHNDALQWGLKTMPVYAVENLDLTQSDNNKNQNDNKQEEKNDEEENDEEENRYKLINMKSKVPGKVTQTVTRSGDTVTTKIESTYNTGEKKEAKGKEKEFIKLFEDNKEAYSRLKPKWLITIVEKGERTANFTDLTKYLLYKLTGYNYGVKKFDFNIFAPDDFKSMKSSSFGGGLDQFIRYLEAWEGSTPITADGKRYVIGTDGYGHPTVGPGIDIINGGYTEIFKKAGYPTEIGGEVDKEFVDNLMREEIKKSLEAVEQYCSGLNLTQYQKYALVSRIYNAGQGGAFCVRNGKDFQSAYNAYWDPEKDNEYKASPNDSMYSHQLYTQYLYKPNTSNNVFSQGLENRRKSEFILFKTGYYDRINEYYEEGGDFLSKAEEIHAYMEENSYTYSLDGNILPATFEASKTGHQVTCCATYVSWVLYECGYEECKGVHNCTDLSRVMEPHTERITTSSMSDLEPGDMCFWPEGRHVQIYAGDGTWYNAGSTDYIRIDSPYKGSDSGYIYALRLKDK